MRHGPEFEDGKDAAVTAHALLTKKDWSARSDADSEANYQKRRHGEG